MIKNSNSLSGEFKKIYMQEIKLYMKFFEDKVKNDEAFTEQEIDEGVDMIRDKLKKIIDLNSEN